MRDNSEGLKILLVYPRYPHSFWGFNYALKFISKKVFAPPLGLLTVAALLPRSWILKFVDMNADPLKDEDIQWADYIFISAMEVQEKSAREIITAVKSQEKKIVAGGPLFTLFPEWFPDVDHLILQEAEATLPRFIEDLKKGKEKHIYISGEWPDLVSSPIPDWSLIDISKYAVMSIQYCRGCPYDCEFCEIAFLNGKKPRVKTVAQILNELEQLYQIGWKGIVFFADDNFILAPQKLKEALLPAIIKWMEQKGYPFQFLTQTTIGLVDDEELMELMIRAGFDSVFVGIETPEEQGLDECHKVQNKNKDLIGAVKKMQRYGLQVLSGFIVGFDSDPPDIFQRQIKFIQESGIVTAMVGLLNAPRGTKLYKRLQQEGRLLRDNTGDGTDTNLVPQMGYRHLMEGYKHLVNYIYMPRHFYERLVTFLENYNLPKQRSFTIQLSHIKALIHSIWVLGLFGKERYFYWKTFWWIVLKRPRLFPLFQRLAIYGFHFRKLFEGLK